MEKLSHVSGIAVPFLYADIDTDQISPGTELLTSAADTYERWAATLFARLRFDANRLPRLDFILNQEPWKKATILLAGENFGCGSSREWAVKALRGFGFRVILAPSFGEIFFSNCFRHGILPAILPFDQISLIAEQVNLAQGQRAVSVDLQTCNVTAPDGTVFPFNTSQALLSILLEGADEIDFTLKHDSQIQTFREVDRLKRPWVYLR